MAITPSQEKQAARVLVDKITSGDERLVKEAASSLDKFIRKTFKETSFSDKILEPVTITPDDFYQSLDSDKPQVLLEIEPEYRGITDMAFNTPAPIMTFGAKRTLVGIDRIKSHRLRKEVLELASWSVSLRDIMADFQLKELMTHKDTRFMKAIAACVGSKPNTVMAATNSVHYHQVYGGLTHNALAESLKYIPRLGRDENGLNSKTLLMNSVTFKEFAKWQPLTAGEKFTTDILNNGLQAVESGVFGCKFIQTIKRGLVPDGVVWHFGDPSFLGRAYELTPPTMIIKNRDHSVEFSIFTEIGGALFVYLGIAKVEYPGV